MNATSRPGPRAFTPTTFSAAGLALALALGGCTSDTTASTTSTSGASSTTSSSTTVASSGDVVAAAEAFLATLSDDQKTAVQQDYTLGNATNWSNLPNALVMGGGGGPGGDSSTSSGASGRVGLQTDSLSDEQWTALWELLATATGSADNEGLDEIRQHLEADDYLVDQGGGSDYGSGQYFLAFLGTPSDTGTWELQFGGHHLAVANTYTDGALVGATPSFRGIEPMDTVEVDGDTVQPEQQERAAFAALLASFSDDQLSQANLSTTFNDIVLGPGSDWAFPTTAEGLAGSELSDDQKTLLLAAINTYVDDVDDVNAAEILAAYEADLDDTYVAYTGDVALESHGDYIRIDGPRVWIEFSMQNGIVMSGAHPHAVWRDKVSDYGGTTA